MRIKSSLQIILLTVMALALAIGSLPVAAQGQSGGLFGTAASSEGVALPGVTLTLTGSGVATMTFVTDAQGQFRFVNLPAGQYDLKAELEGFSTVELPIQIQVGRNTTVEISMTPAEEEVIIVTTESPQLLEDAIVTANNDPAINAIFLDPPGIGDITYNLTRPLPPITDELGIFNISDNSEIELNGANLGQDSVGLDYVNTKGYVFSLKITGFQTGIRFTGPNGGTTITDCFITDNRNDGVSINGAPDIGIFSSTISGNGGNGITINNVNTGMIWIQNNNIGIGPDGRLIQGNRGEGIQISNSSGVMIGGTNPGEGNNIGGNGDGMSIIDSNKITVQASYFGTNAFGDKLGNLGAAIGLAGNSFNNKIGGDSFAAINTIANNGHGIIAFPGTFNNLFLFNRFFDNTGLAINLNFPDGANPNDPGDGDTGANRLQNHPLVTSADASGSVTDIRATLNSTPNTAFGIQYYSSNDGEEGKDPLGSRLVTTDANGNANADVRIPVPLAGGLFIIALADNLNTGDTSEFSPGVRINGTGMPDLEVTKTGPGTAKCGDTITYTITVRNVGTAAALFSSVVDTLPECVGDQVEVAGSDALLSFPKVGNKVVALVPMLSPGGPPETITIKATLTENCGGSIVNLATGFVERDSNTSNDFANAATNVDCVKITGVSRVGKNAFVTGAGFQKGDQVDINGIVRNGKLQEDGSLKVKKGGKDLRACDPADPGRMNVLKLIRPSNTAQPLLDTALFATCP